MCLSVCVFEHMCVRADVCACVCAYLCVCVSCVNACMRAYLHVCVCVRMSAYTILVRE